MDADQKLAVIESKLQEITEKIGRLQNLEVEVAELRQLCSEIDRLRSELDTIKQTQSDHRIMSVGIEQKLNTLIEAVQNVGEWIKKHDERPLQPQRSGVRTGDIINFIQLAILIIGLIAGGAIWADHVTQTSKGVTTHAISN